MCPLSALKVNNPEHIESGKIAIACLEYRCNSRFLVCYVGLLVHHFDRMCSSYEQRILFQKDDLVTFEFWHAKESLTCKCCLSAPGLKGDNVILL